MLSSISQSQENKYCMIHLHVVSKVVKFLEAENRMGLPGAGGKKKWGVVAPWVLSSSYER